jgi:hypothetical protein
MGELNRHQLHRCGCADCEQHPYSHLSEQHRAINRVLASLDERNRRRFVGLLAIERGRRAIAPLALITGLSRNTIRRGKQEVEHPTPKGKGRIRQPGGGRPPVEKNSQAS